MPLYQSLKKLALTPTLIFVLYGCGTVETQTSNSVLSIANEEYFQSDGVNILVFNNAPGGLFYDAKTSGVEIIQHGERTATNGDLRFQRTPEQWDGLGELVKRDVDVASNTITTMLKYPEHEFEYKIQTKPSGDSLLIEVILEKPLPPTLEGKAGFNMEFLPSAYWDKSFLMDGKGGQFPRSPSSPNAMAINSDGLTEAQPLAQGQQLTLAPESEEHRISIRTLSENQHLMLLDGRTKAQNGWYVVRSVLPANQSGTVLTWELNVHGQKNWLREPVVGHSQVGYHPKQNKVAYIELDKNTKPEKTVKLIKLDENGNANVALSGAPQYWGNYLRYQYVTFDFSTITEPGIYQLQYGDQTTKAFPINDSVYSRIWQPTLDYFLPIQMDHMLVKEAYRTWHGLSHMDDALQAPPNYEHFDLYAHDENTDTNFKTFEHIPGLDIGGWYDAGDYDIRTESQYKTVLNLVLAYEEFGIDRDNTTVRQDTRFVELQRPDGKADMLQQIEHGTLALIAQYRSIGHAIPGIVAGNLYQYPHLGDGSTKSDNKIYDKKLDPHAGERSVGKMYNASTVDPRSTELAPKIQGNYSGQFDDRWAFTSNTTALNYGSSAALVAASRVLKEHNPALAKECFETAEKVWAYEEKRLPNTYRYGNTTGDKIEVEKFKLVSELLLSTQDPKYIQEVYKLMPLVKDSFRSEVIALMVKIAPLMDANYLEQVRIAANNYVNKGREFTSDNPYGVPIGRGGWAGNSWVVQYGISAYWLHKLFPDIANKNDTFNAMHYIFGAHPDSNYSFVSGVGASSQTHAYGMNRADFSFIPGGMVPGILVLKPDYPENKSNWPFFWGQNEYVIPEGSRMLFLINAAQRLLNES